MYLGTEGRLNSGFKVRSMKRGSLRQTENQEEGLSLNPGEGSLRKARMIGYIDC